MRQWIERQVLPRFADVGPLSQLGDAAVLPPLAGRPVLTTDSYVVSPLFFPGGDIGRLAVFGTANDLAVSGARPRWMSLSLILEEGLSLELLGRVLDSVRAAAKEAEVEIVTGDTKVVPRGAADRLFVNTSGIGELQDGAPVGPATLEPGDKLIVSGSIARHGVAVLAAREQLLIEPMPTSDCGLLWPAVRELLAARVPVRALRDATRGGVAAVLHEWARASGTTLSVDERALPVGSDVRGACELLGLDPLHVANEGTMLVATPREHAERAAEVLRGVPISGGAVIVGEVEARGFSSVTVRRSLGRPMPLDEPSGAPLPRIC